MYTNDELLKRRAGLSVEKMALLQQRIRHTSVPERDAMTIPRRPSGTSAPLSFAQQRLWFLQQLDPENTAYNEVIALHLHGVLNYEALTRAVRTLVQRHEILRSVFPIVGDEVCQVVSPVEQKNVAVPLVDLRHITHEPMREARRWIDVEVQRPFHLVEELPWRTCLLRLDEEEHIFLTNMHHIITDAWSLDLFVRELMALYRTSCAGLPSSLPDLPVQYADYAYWQRQWLAGAVLDRQVAYWQQQLSGTLPVLHLPTDRSRPPVWTHQGQRCQWEISATLYDALCQLSRREGVTLFMVLLAAFNVLLYRYTMQEDILVGTPVAGRTRPELETLLGCFVNTLVLHTDLSGNPTFRELLQRVRAMALGAYDHQDVPFEKLVEVLKPERNMGRNPLFQVMFVLQNISLATNGLTELTVTPVDLDSKTSRLDISLVLQENAHSLHGYVEYSTDLFDATTIERMLGHYQKILEGVVAHPTDRIANLPLLRTAEEQQIVVEWNTTHVPYPETLCVHQMFEAQAERTPDATAIVFEHERLTYRELNEQANQLAHFLRANGVGADSVDVPVAVYMERSPLMIVSLLAILKAGGAYVPLDPTYPADRLAFMLEDSKAPIVLAQARQLASWTPTLGQVIYVDTQWEQITAEVSYCFAHNPTTVACDHLAYIIYTSGSTGRPKGVMVTHRNLLHSTSARVSYYRQPVGRFLLLSSFAFDSSNGGIFWTLCHGGTLILPAEDKQKDLTYLLHTVEREQVSHTLMVPSLYKVLLAQPSAKALNTLRVAIVGGEICSKELVERHYRLLPHTVLFNEYGPTEGTVWCSVYACQPHEPHTRVPIGRPIANTQLYILDQYAQPVPVGVPGELHIGGIGVARGYLNSPALTAERFVPHCFSAEQGARLYKTGDLACYLPDGTIEFLGRSDTQVKVRGFRIELAEIEAVLGQHPAISACIVLAREDTLGDTRVVAYVMLASGQSAPPEELRRFLNERLPSFMLPSIYMYVDQLPLLPNGKIDRRALPTPDISRPVLEVDFITARDPVEEIVAGIWSRVLGIDQIGMHDDFFALGGHSLLQAQVAASVHAAFGIDLPLLSFFLSPTVATLAEAIKQHLQEDLASVMPPLLPVSRERELPLSFTQQRQWLLDQLDPQSHLSTIFGAVRLQGPLQIMALEQSLREVVRRHEMLRTTFAMHDDDLVQLVAPSCLLPLTVVDLQGLPQSEQEYAMMYLINREKQWSFDLSHGPLLRASILRLAEEEHILLLTSHHIIFDGWSVELLQRELALLYTAFVQDAPSPLADLPVQYADYACWQREVLQGKTLTRLLDYWKQQLVNLPVLTLPADHPRLAARTFRAGVVSVSLPPDLATALNTLSRGEGVTLFMALLAAFQAVLARYSGQSDSVVGSPIANRHRTELEGMIGCFINTLVLRTDVGGNPTYRELLKRVRETALGAYAHQELPFEKLLEALQPERDPGRNPLFQVLFALQNIPQQPLSIPGLTTSFLSVESETTIYDLDLTMWEHEGELVGSFKYNADLFDPPLIKRIKDDFVALLELVVTDPDQHIAEIPLLSSIEQQQLLVEWNATGANYDREVCIQQLFEVQAERTPHAVAVVCGEESLTYGQLNRQANQLAHHLRSLGVAPGSMVAIFMDRSLEMIPALIAILKAGASYVPLEVRFPMSRIAWILSSLDVQVMITQSLQLALLEQLESVSSQKHIICMDVSSVVSAHAEELQPRVWTRSHLDQLSSENLPVLATSNAIAYVIFTSGSTGTPKGVMVRHQPVINLINWVNRTFTINAADRMLFVTSLCFDLSVYDIFGMLAAGGSIQVALELDLQEPERLLDMLYREPITFWDSAPAALQQLVSFFPIPAMSDERSRLRLVFLSGDWIPVKLPDQVRSAFPGAEVVSLGGATEATVWSNFYRIGTVAPEWVSIPYGKPIQNAQYYILDTYLQPCPTGVPGDLYISGECLATGYAGEPELTAQKFIPSPFSVEPGMRLYRTGDLARFWADGTMEFLGRSDAQVKIRGFRVELGEIEVALLRHPAVQVAIIEARRDATGEKRLVAYVVAEAGQMLSTRELRAYLQEFLPDYMVPTAFVLLDTLPLTPNGKVDRRKLPLDDELFAVEQAASYIAPTTLIEETMASIWSDVLKLPRVGIHDNFFEIGGHSLLAVQLISRVRAAWQIHLPLRDLFAFSTVAMLAARVEEVLMAAPAQVAQDAPVGVWYDDAVLDPAIRPEGTYSAVTAEPATMFLTNSTGFLGTFLLAELLHKTSATMYCLVRCHSDDDGMSRIKTALEAAYVWQPEFADRIIPVRGDLAQPLLGVSALVFEQLATTIDVIYHNASLVSSVLPYEELKATNVLGTVDVLRLATQRKVKPLHYISTLSVFSPAGVTPGQPVLEEDALDKHRDYLLEGYEQSKWVAEKLVALARERGLPVAIYRPGRMTGHSRTGVWQTDDLLCRQIKGCIQLGSIPTIIASDVLEMIPVDYISQSIVALSSEAASLGHVFHLWNATCASVGEIVAWINDFGYPVQQVSYDTWHTALQRTMQQTSGNTLAPFLTIYPEQVQEHASQVSTARIIFDDQNTRAALAATSIACPPVDVRLLHTYLSYLVRCGFLPAPTSTPHIHR